MARAFRWIDTHEGAFARKGAQAMRVEGHKAVVASTQVGWTAVTGGKKRRHRGAAPITADLGKSLNCPIVWEYAGNPSRSVVTQKCKGIAGPHGAYTIHVHLFSPLGRK